MKTVFLATDSVGAKYLAHSLCAKGKLDAIVLETAAAKTRKKLKREFRASNGWRWPVKLLDFASVYLYARAGNRYLEEQLLKPNGITGYPQGVAIESFENASGGDCIAHLKSLAPDIVVVYGTSILKPDVLRVPKHYMLNIHGGIVPRYRNVHSDFWAFYDGDFANIGTSILHLDPGIDSGPIALQGRIALEAGDGLLAIKKKNLKLAADLILQALEQASAGTLARSGQDTAHAGFYKTPRFLDFMRLKRKARRPVAGVAEQPS